jgi:hypothetical protein
MISAESGLTPAGPGSRRLRSLEVAACDCFQSDIFENRDYIDLITDSVIFLRTMPIFERKRTQFRNLAVEFRQNLAFLLPTSK